MSLGELCTLAKEVPLFLRGGWLNQGKDSSPRDAGCFGERQNAGSKYSCLRERMCWWIVFEIILCVFIENIVFP